MNIKNIGRHYLATPAYQAPYEVVRGFRQFVIDLAQVELQEMIFEYVDFPPYLRGSELCLQQLGADASQGKILISTIGNSSDLLGKEVNLIFRCLHEMHHVKLNTGFDWQGECACARYFMSLTDNLLFQQILLSEFLGQAAVRLYTGEFPNHQKVVLFAPELVRCLLKG